MKKRLSEDLAREAGEVDQGEPISGQEKAKENRVEPVNDIILTTNNVDEYIATCPRDEKDRPIVPDSIFDKYYKILPDKTINESRSWLANNGGKLVILGGDPERDKQIFKAGADASNARQAQRRSMAEDIQIMLAKKATPEAIANLGLSADANNQEAIIAAALLQALDGNMKAQQFIRDTIGEQPTIKQEVDIMTDDDRKLLENISNRLT